MKLSLVFELLMIFVLLAFAASRSVKHHKSSKKGIRNKSESSEVGQIEDNSINKYCKCVDAYCNCCRDFALPLVNLNGPGCASLTYLSGDKMAVSLSFGKKVITNRTLSSRKPSPVCMPLPGGLSKFCGRVYNIARTGEEFRACLGLELQSKSVVEAAVRVSCFKFGAKGVTSEPADPLPLIPDEKGDKDDDDDDDDDDYGLGGDDDDDDDDADDDEDESELEAVNDVGGSDYTGFSLLEDDLLGDLFGSSGGKKGNKKKNQIKIKKKQAPAPSTTTTKRPRPTRRPSSRRPSTRITTPRPTRTTTVRIRPVNKRPTRRPSRRPTRPNRTSTTAQITEITPASILTASPSPTTTTSKTTTTTTTTIATPVIAPVTAKIHFLNDHENAASDGTFEPIIAVRPQSTTPKSVTDFEHTGLEMSLAHITGQLSSMPVLPLNNEPKDSEMATHPEEQVTYQKVEMITPKALTTLPMETPSSSPDETVNDDMIQIVQTLDSSEEALPAKEEIAPEESRAYFYSHPVSGDVISGAFKNHGENRPKKRQRDDLGLPDLDVLDLTQIGESIGDELGIFGGKKRTIRYNEDSKVKGDNHDYSEYHDVIDTMGDALLLSRKSSPKDTNKKKRGRQNKMMRGDWALV